MTDEPKAKIDPARPQQSGTQVGGSSSSGSPSSSPSSSTGADPQRRVFDDKRGDMSKQTQKAPPTDVQEPAAKPARPPSGGSATV